MRHRSARAVVRGDTMTACRSTWSPSGSTRWSTARSTASPTSWPTLVRNVVVLVEDEPPEGEPDDLLGLYDGVALTERDSTMRCSSPTGSSSSAARCSTCARPRSELVEEVRITVVHEIAHHFGIDDHRLHELGYA